MGRKTVMLPDARILVLGYDRPFKTLYAALYDPEDDMSKAPGHEGEERPLKAFGYHPAEVGSTPPDTEYGPYPVTDLGEFDRLLAEWGMTGEIRESAGIALARDSDCDPAVIFPTNSTT